MNETERARLRTAIAQIMGWGDDPIIGYEAFTMWKDHKGATRFESEIPDYPGNIVAAWQVLEHFEWPGNYTRLQRTDTGKWRCDIELRGGDGPVRSAFDENVCIAICKAAHFAATGKEWQ